MSSAVPTRLLLAIDLQRAFCDQGGSMARQGRDVAPLAQAARAANALAHQARRHAVPVIWTRMVFQPDYADGGELTRTIRPNLQRIGALARGSGDEAFSSLVEVAAVDEDIEKPRFSALIGTRLEVILAARRITDVMICGVTTSMCVESTVRDLGQRDYRVSVVADACADFAPEIHAASLAAMAFGFARIVDTAAALTVLERE